MAHKAPGKSHRKGISLLELADMFPDERAAVKWFEDVMWNGERCCGHCGSLRKVESDYAVVAAKNREDQAGRCPGRL